MEPPARSGGTVFSTVTWKSGEDSTRSRHRSVYRTRFALHVIHQEILAQVVRRGEVGFAFAHLRYFLDELHQAVVRGQHEGVDHDAGALALIHFLQCFADYEGVQAESVLIDSAVLQRECGRLAV